MLHIQKVVTSAMGGGILRAGSTADVASCGKKNKTHQIIINMREQSKAMGVTHGIFLPKEYLVQRLELETLVLKMFDPRLALLRRFRFQNELRVPT